MRKPAELLIRLALLCAALFTIGIGGSMFVYCRLGSDPCNLLGQGIGRLTGLPAGAANNLIQVIVLVVMLFLWREKIGIGTFFTFITGFSIDFWIGLYESTIGVPSLPLRIAFALLGPVFVGLGVAAVQLTDLGMVPNDIPAVYLYRRQKRFQFRTIRILYDLAQLILGVLLGSVVGFGTLCAAFLTGPWIQAFLKLLRGLHCPYLTERRPPDPT